MTDSKEDLAVQALETLKAKLNRDTAKISWSALAEHHQKEAVIRVDNSLDLITVAGEFAQDNHNQVKQWLDEGTIGKVGIKTGENWLEQDVEVWAVVIAPWILVQELEAKDMPELVIDLDQP
jgi:hypothetical protein